MISISFPIEKNYNPLLLLCPLCTLTKSNLYLTNSLAAAVSENALYRLLTFQVPNLVAYVVPKHQSRSGDIWLPEQNSAGQGFLKPIKTGPSRENRD
jgi:hypothetical protein